MLAAAPIRVGRSYMPMALWASSMCFMHSAVSPFVIAAFDVQRHQSGSVQLTSPTTYGSVGDISGPRADVRRGL
jgi:hypothetical protein